MQGNRELVARSLDQFCVEIGELLALRLNLFAHHWVELGGYPPVVTPESLYTQGRQDTVESVCS